MVAFALVLILLYISSLFGGNGIKQFDKAKIEPLRGVLAVIIILHHIYLSVGYEFLSQFKSWGAIVVSIFLFVSGYGLSKSLTEKGTKYLDSFLFKRVFLGILLPFIVVVVCQIILSGEAATQNIIGVLKNNGERWFIVAILFLYTSFYVLTKYCSTKYLELFIGCATTIFVLIATNLDFGRCWYISIWAFLSGLIYSKIENSLIERSQSTSLVKYLAVPLLMLLIGISYILGSKFSQLTIVCYSIVYAIIPVMFSLLCSSLRVEVLGHSHLLMFLSKISYEVYLCHGVVILYLMHIAGIVENRTIFTSLTLLLTVVFAWIVKLITSKVV